MLNKNNFSGLIKQIDYNKTYRVLFIGNSYTFFNNSWDIFKKFAETKGIKVETDEVTNGGWSLAQMADPNDTFGAKVREYLSKRKYDFVFMQEQSLRPAINPEMFFQAVRELHKLIEDNGARDVLFETWGRKTGSLDLQTYNMTNYTMTQKLIASYGTIGEELDIPISHVGTAFYKVFSNHPEIELYDQDLYHPNINGSYLLAMVHFVTVFGIDPRGISYTQFDHECFQNVLETAAYEAVFEKSILVDNFIDTK